MRTGKYTGYDRLAVKLPAGLRERIDRLVMGSTAKGEPITRNGWIVRELARRAKWGEYEPNKTKEVKGNE